jgi:SAM-dependent methyltransferase
MQADSELQTEVLENLTETKHYRDWLCSLARPYLGDNPLELGCGNGDYAAHWLSHGLERITLTEIDPVRYELVRQRFAGDTRVKFAHVDIESPQSADYTAMVSFNVLEHIENDSAALSAARDLLLPGGYVFHLVPAFPFAMSDFDRRVGHFRRYRKRDLIRRAQAAGLEVEKVHYLNAPGLVAWLLFMRLLRGAPKPGPLLTVWDSCVIPVERRIERIVRPPFGQSAVLIARTPR